MAFHDQHLRAPVSVIIPAFNAAATIGRALASVASQTARPDEVIIVDDGSQDQTAEIARTLARAMPDLSVRILSQPNRGAGAARNRALAEARAPYVAFLDADDEWLPEKLEASLRYLEHDGLTLVAHNGWLVRDGGETLLDTARRYRAARDNLFSGLYRRGFIATSSVVARRDALAAAGGFDEALRTGQDFDLWLRVLKEPDARFFIFDRALTRHHETPGSITSHTRRRLANTLEIAIRHAPVLARRGVSPLVGLWFRVLAVHCEAFEAFWRRREYRDAIGVAAATPSALALATVRVMQGGGVARSARRARYIEAGLYVWMIAALAAYLRQFNDAIVALARQVGM